MRSLEVTSLNSQKVNLFTLDIGNTSQKAACFYNNELRGVFPWEEVKLSQESAPIAISNVSTLPTELKNRKVFSFEHLREENSFLDMPVNYSKGLGLDRLYLSYYAYKTYLQDEFIIIDAGTFITVDHVSKDKGFISGLIYPGIQTFLDSYQKGKQLPHLKFEILNQTSAHSTEEALLIATKEYLLGIWQTIKDYKHIILTGGNAKVLQELFGSKKIQLKEYYIHEALNYLYQNREFQ